ncbi:calcium homeostasis endoplasmic reticulum protein-like [Pollicipes pollicipes]|uniref:calcium homeostasis endoplasmic reticulum protein-like n=1 Tax=Pollicipes pollicipes TaxID=41117 RepID=UPI001884971A|nr:calcium homeostasis endoplasmic reticulum protein-like [Pollicipes pollicipes]
MDLPQPPADPERRNIIDKLAQFVARNGPDFEAMTKAKQKDNPKFSFLFGGEFFNYYQYKVTTEQAIRKQRELRGGGSQASNGGGSMPGGDGRWGPPGLGGPPSSQGYGPPPFQPFSAAPYQSGPPPGQYDQYGGQGYGPPPAEFSQLPPQQAAPPTPAPAPAPPPAAPHALPAAGVESITQQLQHLTDQITQSEQNLSAQQQVLLQQQSQQSDEAIRRAQDEQVMELARETAISAEEFDQVLEPIISSCTKDGISHGKQWIFAKAQSDRHSLFLARYLLRRVVAPGVSFNLKLHIIYLLNDVLHHCVRKNVNGLHQCLESVVVPMFCNTMMAANQEQKAKLNKLLTLWESKANYFSESALSQLKEAPASWQAYQADLLEQHAAQIAAVSAATKQQFDSYKQQHEAFVQHALQQIQQLQQQLEMEQQAAAMPMVDLSRPPPGFTNEPAVNDDDLVPSVPYFDLPAGLMAPMIPIEANTYRSLDPAAIRLPPPAPPSERLLAAVEAFYAPASHDRPRNRNLRPEDLPNRRDRDGWEQLALYEFYKAKKAARRQLEKEVEEGQRDESPPPSPIRSPSTSRSPTPVKERRYSSASPEPEERSRARRRRSRSGSGSGSGSDSSSRSGSPAATDRRSPTPPSFAGFGAGTPAAATNTRLDESNKGHQLLKAMGWGGAGLGSKEQGIAEPISGGEVRDRQDQYKGIGVNLHDPYENFRKSKGQAFISRMKERQEEMLLPVPPKTT